MLELISPSSGMLCLFYYFFSNFPNRFSKSWLPATYRPYLPCEFVDNTMEVNITVDIERGYNGFDVVGDVSKILP